jgi:hypothetical protein
LFACTIASRTAGATGAALSLKKFTSDFPLEFPRVFTAGILTWNGRYDRFENVPMEMAPLQKPHPPLWYGAHSADSAERAAQKGFNIVTNDSPSKARLIID